MCGQRTPGHETASDRGAVGRLRGVDGTVDRRPAERRTRAGPAVDRGSRRPVRRCRPRPVPPRRRSSRRPTRTTSPSSARCPSPRQPTRPRTILVAYEMNGEPLTPDHGAPFRLIVPHWYAVASVKWLKRIDVLTEPFTGEFQTGHYIYQWPDRPHEAVRLMRVRARITDPAPGAVLPLGPYTVRGKAWSGTGPVTQVDISLTGEGDWHPAQLDPPKGPYQWQDWSLRLGRQRRRTPHPPRPGDRRRRQRPTRRPTVEPAGLRQQRHRSPLRRPALIAA